MYFEHVSIKLIHIHVNIDIFGYETKALIAKLASVDSFLAIATT